MPPRSRAVLLAWAAVFGLLVVLAVLIVTFTPWDPLPGADIQAAPVGEYFTGAQIARSERFFDLAIWPSWIGLVISLAAAVVIGFTKAGRLIVTSVRGRFGRWWQQVIAIAVVISVVELLVTLPFEVWSQQLNRVYGLSTQSWLSWARDRLTSLAIVVVTTCVALLLLVGLARRFVRTWFMPASIGAAVLVVGVSFAYPIVVDPLFNKVTPMPDSPLRTSLIALADRDGVDVSDVMIADASRRTTAENAYVSGFGSTKRIVVYDTLLDNATDDEIRVIVGHELSHAKHDDVIVGTIEGALAAALGVVLLFLLLRPERLRRPAGAGSMGDPAIVPIVLALVTLATFLGQPVANTISRHIEARADAHSLDLTRDPQTFIEIQQQLALANLTHLTPNPLLSFWFSTHPPTLDRIGMANAWEELQGDHVA